ncbi:MAG: transposase [Nitrososphaerales archaeon]|nr:transposase [Nitrososphaerales archaeon]
MIVTYRFRLYPNKTQAHLMEQTLETCRRLYNDLLAERNEDGTGFYDLQHSLVERKGASKYLRAVHSQVLQDVNIRLDKAFQAFFAGLARHPRFKRSGRYNSFTYTQPGGFKIIGDRLKLSRIGSVKIKLHREIIGTPRRCAIIRDIDRWYVCVMVEQPELGQPPSPKPAIGVDLGVLRVATLSDGTRFDNPRCLKTAESSVKKLQRSLSRKHKGSHSREKARMLLAKAHRHIRNQRRDYAHNVSRHLAYNYSTIVFEDLKIPNMVRNHNLASAIMDASWGQPRQLTAYKAERRGGRVILVDPSGTSQICSGCAETVPKDLSVRVHACPNCGLVVDRDENAARNILKRGLERAPAEERPLLVQRTRISKFSPVKQEANGFNQW